jgi:hypothetical protein
MLGHAGWGEESFGARDCRRGEWDTAVHFVVWMGVPVYFSFRGCVHVIEPALVTPAERLERLRAFAHTCLGMTDLPRSIHLPLRALGRLKRLVLYELGLWLLACFPLVAVIATPAILQQPNPFLPENVAFLKGCWAGTGVFVLALAAYLRARRPSRRQARIREVVAGLLGPFSDPADWRTDLVTAIAPAFGVEPPNAADLVEEAQRRLRSGQSAEALLLARLAVGLAAEDGEDGVAMLAENTTEECLLHLGDARAGG